MGPTRRPQQRRAAQRRLRKLLFFGLLVTASLTMGYVIGGYEPTVHVAD